jgi:predicted nucleotidyltransferase
VDLSSPWRSLTTALDGEVLTVLARTDAPVTGREVARLSSRGTHAGVQKVLDRLVAHGLVHAQEAGRARLYVLDRQHVLAPAVLAVAGARTEVLGRLRELVAGWEVGCLHASVFGSVARRDATADSDIDVLVVRPSLSEGQSLVWERQLAAAEEQVDHWTGNALAWFEVDVETLRAAESSGSRWCARGARSHCTCTANGWRPSCSRVVCRRDAEQGVADALR